MRGPKQFWGMNVAEILNMEYALLAEKVIRASGLSADEVIAEVTRRRVNANSDAETLACSRIISACLDGPDVVNF